MAVGLPANGSGADHLFLTEVLRASATRPGVEACIQCGTCGGSCPSAAAMDHTPRLLFALVRAGMRDEALRSNTPWMCLSCYFCTVRCPHVHPHPGRDVRHQVDCHARGRGRRAHGRGLLDDVRAQHPPLRAQLRDGPRGPALPAPPPHAPARPDRHGPEHGRPRADGFHASSHQAHRRIARNPRACCTACETQTEARA